MHNPVTNMLATVDIFSFFLPNQEFPFFSTFMHNSSSIKYTSYPLTHQGIKGLFNKKHRLNITTILNK